MAQGYDYQNDPTIQTLMSLNQNLEAESARRKAAYDEAMQDLAKGIHHQLSAQGQAAGQTAAQGQASGAAASAAAANAGKQAPVDKDAYLAAAENSIAGDSQLNDPREGADREMGQEREAVDAAAAQQRAEEMNARPNPYLGMPNGTLANRQKGREIGDFLASVRNPQTEGSQQGYHPDTQAATVAMSPEKKKMMDELEAAKSNTIHGMNSVSGKMSPEKQKIMADLERARLHAIDNINRAHSAHVTAAELADASMQASQLRNMPPAPMPTLTQPNLPDEYGPGDYAAYMGQR